MVSLRLKLSLNALRFILFRRSIHSSRQTLVLSVSEKLFLLGRTTIIVGYKDKLTILSK